MAPNHRWRKIQSRQIQSAQIIDAPNNRCLKIPRRQIQWPQIIDARKSHVAKSNRTKSSMEENPKSQNPIAPNHRCQKIRNPQIQSHQIIDRTKTPMHKMWSLKWTIACQHASGCQNSLYLQWNWSCTKTVLRQLLLQQPNCFGGNSSAHQTVLEVIPRLTKLFWR